MSVIKAMYLDASTKVRMNGERVRLLMLKLGAPGLGSQPTAIHYRVGGFV